MGSAAAYHLASRGLRVLGLDRLRPPHELGSSHGRTRIIREAYFEHPAYVPLVQRAYELWADLERKSGRQLLRQTGGLMIGPADGPLVMGSITSARKHNLPCELLSETQLRRRCAPLEPSKDMVAVAEPRAGILFPETVVRTHLELAAINGARLRFDEPVLRWTAEGESIEVETATNTYRADWLILSAGPWLSSLLGDLSLPLVLERQVMLWFEPRARHELFTPDHFPIFICQYAPHGFFYGFPDLGEGLKVALHHEGQTAVADAPRREPTQEDVTPVRQLLRRFLPDADGPLKSAAACLYTNAPDEHFVFGPHPAFPRVIIVSPCSGHGFKFSAVIGEITARLVESKPSGFDLSLFQPDRFLRR